MYTFGSSLVTTENKAVAGRRELMGSRWALQSSLRVNMLIHRGLRVDAESEPVPSRVLLSGVRFGFVRRGCGGGLRPEPLLLRQTPNNFRDGIRPRQWAVLVTVKAVRQSRKLSENHSQTNRQRVSSRVLGDRKRAIPKPEEVTGASHDRSSPVPQRTRDAFGCASLGALTGRGPRP